jgi:hypothetical protein
VVLNTPWRADNMQWAGVFTWQGVGEFTAMLDLINPDGQVATPQNTLDYSTQRTTDGSAYVSLLNPNGSTPPAIGGAPDWTIRLRVTPLGGPYAVAWEAGIFERVPWTPPDPPPGPPPDTECPPRPDWPYPAPSISGAQGRFGVMRGARR